MKFRPLHDRVVVQRMESEQKTAGGIIIPDTAKEKPMEGKVIAAGSGRVTKQVSPAAGCESWGYGVVWKMVRHRSQD